MMTVKRWKIWLGGRRMKFPTLSKLGVFFLGITEILWDFGWEWGAGFVSLSLWGAEVKLSQSWCWTAAAAAGRICCHHGILPLAASLTVGEPLLVREAIELGSFQHPISLEREISHHLLMCLIILSSCLKSKEQSARVTAAAILKNIMAINKIKCTSVS